MKPYVKSFEERLTVHFERKAEEFHRFAEERPQTAVVTIQLAGLYRDLAESMRR